MNLTKYILMVFLVVGCGVKKEKIAEPHNLDDLRSEYNTRLAAFDSGWPSVSDCDATLWAGLACFAGVDLDITEAEYEPGVVHRRPKSEGSCFVDGVDLGAKSTVSNDMLSGYILCAGVKNNIGALTRLYEVSSSRDWKTGEAQFASRDRVQMSSNLQKHLADAIYRSSGGEIQKEKRRNTLAYFPSDIDYARHLTSVGFLMADIWNRHEISWLMVRILEANFNKDKNDAFTTAVLGRYEHGYSQKAVDLLLGDYRSPSYVRGDESYHEVHWLGAAKVVLDTDFVD
jgi:hypothetical protein